MILTQTQIRPRSVFCIVERAYQSVAVAEAVSNGRFTHAGVTLEVGLEPDWLMADFPADAEWRIEWSKFYYGLDLAFAFHETGDTRFLRTWERLVLSWIRQVPVDFDASDVTARRITNWIYAWDRFISSPHFSSFVEGFEEQVFDSLTEQATHLRSSLTPERNHRTLELYALFIAVLALPDMDAVGGSLLDFAIKELHSNLLTDVRPDGVHRENSTHYHMLVLRSFLGARENARRFGLKLPVGFDAHLERACEFAMHCHHPDGLIPALSDSDTGSYLDLLELAAGLFSRPDFLFVATRGARGIAPKQRHVSFPDGGYFIQRSDWGDEHTSFGDSRFLIFDCGLLGDGGHGHYDLLNIEIAARGRPLVVDPGRYTYSEHGPLNWRRWFKGTAAHNTVCINGQDQTPYRCGKPKGQTAQAQLIERLSAPNLDLLCGEATSPAYDVIHTRRIFFINGEYWLIVDHLRGSRPHRFDLRFHLAPDAWNHTRVTFDEMNPTVRAPGLALVFETHRQPSIEPGWVSPAYGVKHRAPVVSVVADELAEEWFFTLAMPLDLFARAPKILVHREQASAEEQAILAEVVGCGPDGTATDRLFWSTQQARPFELGRFQGRASAAWLRTSANRDSLAFTACDVHELMSCEPGESLSLDVGITRWVTWDAERGMKRYSKGDMA